MKVISISNQKGGVGKTTISINISSALKELKQRVLLIDIDPQGNCTTGLGVDKKNLKYSLYDLIDENINLEDVILKTSSGIDIIPSEIELYTFDINFHSSHNKESLIKNRISKLELSYDYVIIDCPPSLGLLTVNALVASDFVLIPIQCEFYSLEGISQMINSINLVKNKLNTKLELGGILINMFDSRIKIQREILKELEHHFKDKIFRPFIKRNIKLTEASSYGVPINFYEKNSKGYNTFLDIAKEIIGLGNNK